MKKNGQKEIVFIYFLLFILIILFAGCKDSSKTSSLEKLIVSSRDIPNKTIILSPAIVEMFLFLDKKWSSQHIIGISDFTINKNKLKNAITLGSIYNLSFEKLLQLHPKNIIIQGSNSKLTEFCKNYDISFYKKKIESIDDIINTMKFSSEIIQSKIARKKYLIWKNKINQYKIASRKKRPSTQKKISIKKKILLIVHRLKPDASVILSANQNTFLSQALVFAKGRNVVITSKLWPKLTIEKILMLNPDLIIELSTRNSRYKLKNIKINLKKKLNVNLKRFKYKLINDKFLLMPTHRILNTIKLFKKNIDDIE